MVKDRNGMFLGNGTRVKNIYSDEYGTIVDYLIGCHYPRVRVAYDSDIIKAESAVCLEAVGGGITDEEFRRKRSR